MLRVTIIGGGNVAYHLIRQIKEKKDLILTQVFVRDTLGVEGVSNDIIINDWDLLKDSDIYVIAVSDDAINQVVNQFPFTDKLVVHTSGTHPIGVLNPKNRRGVWYPLQSFSKEQKLSFLGIPFCIETEHKNDFAILKQLTQILGGVPYGLDSNQRKALHVAAVFANNFVNQLYHLSASICEQNNLPFEIVQPLIQQTALKIQHAKPVDVQTGPAVRADQTTIQNQQAFLKDNSIEKKIYKLLTESIQKTHVKKL